MCFPWPVQAARVRVAQRISLFHGSCVHSSAQLRSKFCLGYLEQNAGAGSKSRSGEGDREETVYWSACISANGLVRAATGLQTGHEVTSYIRFFCLFSRLIFYRRWIERELRSAAKRAYEIINSRLFVTRVCHSHATRSARRGFRASRRSNSQ